MSDGEAEYGRVPRLAPGCDPSVLALSAQEGFLLSRIDGHTPWRILREIAVLPPEEVDLCLEGWLATGVIVMDEARPATQQPRTRLRRPGSIVSPGEVDESLDLDVETQRRILDFEGTLDRPYHELLGVAANADPKQIKRAYFTLSKEFHPDRYFRKNIGHFKRRLERIFKRILEAHEILSDPELRAELEKTTQLACGAAPVSEASGPAKEGATPRAASERAAVAPAKSAKQSKLDRLRQRMPFRIATGVHPERQKRAREFYDASQVAARRGQYIEATSSLRLAITFDPYNPRYREGLGELQAQAAQMRAAKVLEGIEGSAEWNEGELRKALKLLEEVLLYRPHDPEVNHKAGELALELEDHARARDYAQTAVEHSPEVARYHSLLGRVHAACGDPGHARAELERAIQLDPDEARARKAIAALRIGRVRPAQGGGQ